MAAYLRKLEEEKWRSVYGEHWQRVLAAIPSVDDKMKPFLKCDEQSTLDNIRDMVMRLKENMAVMMNIATYTFVEGKVNSYRDEKAEIPGARNEMIFEEIKLMENENHFLGNRILNAQATFSTFDNIYAKKPVKKTKKFKIPKSILKRYNLEELNLPWENHLLKLFLRPKIFIVLGVSKSYDVSRLEVELYTEAAPQVVFDLIRTCRDQDFQRIKVLRGFKQVWLDCEVILDQNSMSLNKIDFDGDALANDKQSGILSISKRYLDGFSHGHLNFSISFRPLAIPKGHRIAFGRLVSGFRALSKLEEFATMRGGLKKDIYVTECGIDVDTSAYKKKCEHLSKLPHLQD